MTDELKSAIDKLYVVFKKHPFNPKMEFCPCCVTKEEIKNLNIKPLRNLEEEDLVKYAFSALSTWGSEDDFKHFLPRIFELASTTTFHVDYFVILNKLENANWDYWSSLEQSSVKEFLQQWWINHVKNDSWLELDLLADIIRIDSSSYLLDNWIITHRDNSLRNLMEKINKHSLKDLQKGKGIWKKVDKKERLKVYKWMKSQFSMELFYEIEKEDPELSYQILRVLPLLGKEIPNPM